MVLPDIQKCSQAAQIMGANIHILWWPCYFLASWDAIEPTWVTMSYHVNDIVIPCHTMLYHVKPCHTMSIIYKPNLFHRDRQNSTEIFVWPLLMQCILAIAVCWHCLMLSEQVSTDADVRISGWIPAISKTLSNCLAEEHLHYITWYTDTNTILTLKNMMNDQMNTNDLLKKQ